MYLIRNWRKIIIFIFLILIVIAPLSAGINLSADNVVLNEESDFRTDGAVVHSNSSTFKSDSLDAVSNINSQNNQSSNNSISTGGNSKDGMFSVSLDSITGLIAAVASIGVAIYAALEYYRKKKENTKNTTHKNSNIPQNDSIFVGREEEITTIFEDLKSRFFLVEITGIGGIGKTAIAIKIAEKCLTEHLFSYVIWISAKYEPIDINRLLKAIVSFEYGFTGEDLPIGESTLLAKRILASEKVLLILDNYENIEGDQIANFLREVPTPSKVLLTTRHSKIKEATTIKLNGLSVGDCIKVARNEINRLSIDSMKNISDEDLLSLSEITFGIPFLIKWVMGQVKFGHKYEDITTSISTLKPEANEVYDYIFDKSFKNLDDVAIQILITLSLSKNPANYDFIVGVVNPSIPYVVKNNLDLLINQNLVEVEKSEKIEYKIHPLTRNYTLVYLATSEKFTFMQRRFYDFVNIQAIHSGKDEAPSYNFIDRNFYTILSTIDWFIDKNLWKEAVSLEQGISRYLWVRGYWKLRIDYGYRVLDLARFLMDKKALAKILMDDIGWTTYALYKDSTTASEQIEKAKEIFQEENDNYNLVKSIRHLAAIDRDNNDFSGAEAKYSNALSLINSINNIKEKKEMDSGIHLSLAKLFSKQHNYENALLHIEKAIDGFKETNDELRLLKVLNNKSEILLLSGRIDDAIILYQIVLDSAKKLKRYDQVPITYEGLFQCYLKKEKNTVAKRHFEEALKGYEALGSINEISRLRKKYKDFI